MINKMINFFKDEEGATMVEYALMLALIAIVCIGVVSLLGSSASNVFSNAAAQLPAAS
jgi:pilus assembly protein Flp/PilA